MRYYRFGHHTKEFGALTLTHVIPEYGKDNNPWAVTKIKIRGDNAVEIPDREIFPDYPTGLEYFYRRIPTTLKFEVNEKSALQFPNGNYYLVNLYCDGLRGEKILFSKNGIPKELTCNVRELDNDLNNKFGIIRDKLRKLNWLRTQKLMASVIFSKKPVENLFQATGSINTDRKIIPVKKTKTFTIPGYGTMFVSERLDYNPTLRKAHQRWSITEVTSGMSCGLTWGKQSAIKEICEYFIERGITPTRYQSAMKSATTIKSQSNGI
jgi:hypothetical protein